jgi:Fur family transcriptional regulator, iron response regulator
MHPSPQPWKDKLIAAGLRPTAQRLALARLLFGLGHRHVSAEQLHAEARKAKVPVSLATVYNTLNQLKSVGLLRELAIEGDRSYYDTNTDSHCHFFDEERGELFDIDATNLKVSGLPDLPQDRILDRIDVVVRLKKKG